MGRGNVTVIFDRAEETVDGYLAIYRPSRLAAMAACSRRVPAVSCRVIRNRESGQPRSARDLAPEEPADHGCADSPFPGKLRGRKASNGC